jgi:hypothetical protein
MYSENPLNSFCFGAEENEGNFILRLSTLDH